MSLRGWSLPSRAFAREKSKDSDPNQPGGRFPTVHVSSPGPGKRANISSAFSSLFEKDENRQNVPTTDNPRSATRELQPLSARIENVLSPSESKSLKRVSSFYRPGTPIDLTPGRKHIGQLSSKQDEGNKGARQSSLLKDRNPYARLPEVKVPEAVKSLASVTRVRSASSSYPSEGIRSPVDSSRSPQLNTWSESFLSEMSRYGVYQSQETSTKSSVSTNDVSALHDKTGQCLMEELAATGGVSDTDTRTASGEYTPKHALSGITSVGSVPEQDDVLQKLGCDDDENSSEATQKPPASPSSPGDTIPVPEDQFSSTSAVQGSFPELLLSTNFSSFEDDIPFRPSNAGSMDRLRPSTESRATNLTKIQWQSESNQYHTMPTPSPKRFSRGSLAALGSRSDPEGAHMPGLHFKHSNASSTTLTKRIQKFKLKKWIKKVYLRTKVRFDSATTSTRPETSSNTNTLGKKKTRAQKPRRSKKHGGKTIKIKSKGSWKPPKAAKKSAKKGAKEDGGRANYWFMRSLKTKNNAGMSGREKKEASHRRVQSCPA